MSMRRVVEPELLDTLAPDDPRAIRSRADLRRINRLMGTQSLLGNSLDRMLTGSGPMRLVELGAGDGTLLLRLARRRARHWPKITLGLLDLQPVVGKETLAGYRALGWRVEVIHADVFDWLAQPQVEAAPIVLANLFVHHFHGLRLQALLTGIADRARAFLCLEPRRSQLALLGSHLLGVIGCNDVTRHDAVTSVRAGFSAQELSAQWPDSNTWNLQESAAGLFTHRLHAVRIPTR
ncbi:MAG TPA: hypothetical protein VHF02_05885 [Luteimonas sp.]|nr:hypothetical protein [Luteimonas sp.]